MERAYAEGQPDQPRHPPFKITELITLATSPTWHATVSASTIAAAAGLFTPDPMPTGPGVGTGPGSKPVTSIATGH